MNMTENSIEKDVKMRFASLPNLDREGKVAYNKMRVGMPIRIFFVEKERGAFMENRHKRTSPLFLVVLLVLVAGLAALFIFGGEEKQPVSQKGDAAKRHLMEGGMEWNGQLYRPRNDVTSMLLFGISRENPGEDAPAYGQEQHVSFAQLMLVDHGDKKIYRIPIDTEMETLLSVPDGNGGTTQMRGMVAYGLGAGKTPEENCRNVTEAVSRLLPVGTIDFYLAVEADSLQDLLQIAAGIAKTAVPETASEGNGRLLGRKARADLQSRQMAQLLTMVTQVSSADEQEINRLLDEGGLNTEHANRYPHELSGGMRQRIVIAMALVCNPRLIIADEPTTALDVTIQAQILELLRNLKTQINASIMLITHDLGVIAEMADYVVVMYAGRVVEKGLAHEVFLDPRHPYTIGLMESKPVINKTVDRLYSIPGAVPNPINMPDYCYFRDRCEKCVEKCSGAYPHEMHITDTHVVSCWRYFGCWSNFDEDKGGAQNV